MRPDFRKLAGAFGWISAGLLIALLGSAFLTAGLGALRRLDVISGAYALCGVLWVGAGAAMIAGGLWAAVSIGRPRMPLWIGSLATIVAGATALAGTMTYVIPCGGPS